MKFQSLCIHQNWMWNFSCEKEKRKNKWQWKKQMEIKKVDSYVGTQGEERDITNMGIINLNLGERSHFMLTIAHNLNFKNHVYSS